MIYPKCDLPIEANLRRIPMSKLDQTDQISITLDVEAGRAYTQAILRICRNNVSVIEKSSRSCVFEAHPHGISFKSITKSPPL